MPDKMPYSFKVTGADLCSTLVPCATKHFAPVSTLSCCFLEARSSSSLMVDVPGPFPTDPLLTLALSEQCLQGTCNEENRKLNKGPQSTSLNHFLLQYERKHCCQVVKNPEPRLPVGCSGLCGFTGWAIPAQTKFLTGESFNSLLQRLQILTKVAVGYTVCFIALFFPASVQKLLMCRVRLVGLRSGFS